MYRSPERHPHRGFTTLPRVLALFLLAVAGAAAQVPGREMPEWFAETLLDVPAEAAEAAKAGKRLALYFWLSGCPYCQRMTEDTFRDARIVGRLKAEFEPVGVNVRGDRDIAWRDGKTYTERELARLMRVRGTPTLVFFDERGEEIERVVGYVPPGKLAETLMRVRIAPRADRRSASRR